MSCAPQSLAPQSADPESFPKSPGDKVLQRGAIACFVAGMVARAVYVFWAHPATAYDFSDMHGYFEHAQRIFNPNAEGIFDTFHPPGAAYLFGLTYKLDPTWHAAFAAQWLMSAGVMALTFDIARRLYDARVACVAVIIAAWHYPLVHYAGFFLAENGCAFFTTLCFWALVLAWQATRPRTQWGCGVLGGIAFAIGTAFKNSMLGPGACLALGLCILSHRHKRYGLWRTGLAFVLCAAVFLVPLAQRCTRLHDGVFCLAAANTGANVLIGHYGDAGMFHWHDKKHNVEMMIGSPDAGMRGYDRPVHLQFGGYDDAQNLAVAKGWMRAHPGEALFLSVRNVSDLFAMRTLWPGANAFGIDWGAVSQWLLWLFILPSAVFALGMARRDPKDVEAAMLLLMPIIGLAATVFIAVSEVRYRIPFDALIIALSARGWTQLVARWRLLDRRSAMTL